MIMLLFFHVLKQKLYPKLWSLELTIRNIISSQLIQKF